MVLKIKYYFNLFKLRILFSLGFSNRLLKNKYGERLLIYHGVDECGSTKYNSRFLSKDIFEKQIKYFSENYNIVSIDDYYNENFKKDTLNICITFDDGYLNNCKYAIPILKKYNAPATFFITTIRDQSKFLWPDFVDLITFHNSKSFVFNELEFVKNNNGEYFNKIFGLTLKQYCIKLEFENITHLFGLFKDEWEEITNDYSLDDYWKLMSAEDISKIISNPIFSIGAHGQYHTSFVNVKEESIKSELKYSKKYLEIICNREINMFAFPYGHYNAKSLNLVRNAGFKKIFLVDYNNKSDEKHEDIINRFVMNPFISFREQIKFLLKGTYY